MIRTKYYCPSCQMEEMPVLVRTEWYNCPDCQTISKRKDMLTKRTAKLALAGSNALPVIPVTLVSTASMTDGAQLTASIVSGSFSTVAGDLLIAYLVTWGGSDDSGNTGATVSNGEGPMVNQLTAGANAALCGNLFSHLVTTSGSRTILFSFDNSPLPKSATLAVYRARLAGKTLGLDSSAILRTASTTTPSSGLSGVLLASNDTALAFIGSTQNTADTAPTLSGGFVSDGRDGTNNGFDDCSIAAGSKPLTTNARISAGATFLSAFECVAAVACVRAQ